MEAHESHELAEQLHKLLPQSKELAARRGLIPIGDTLKALAARAEDDQPTHRQVKEGVSA